MEAVFDGFFAVLVKYLAAVDRLFHCGCVDRFAAGGGWVVGEVGAWYVIVVVAS
jgi:hypothetical protein